ncbi:RRXRR domain-containing protein [Micromonospora sp. NPDC006766]|uniref:RRXRR domain-containing protein n=1 Tax=Micromonospora sp. NPDC006766 TaxID=3154778 RepID=UPI0033DC3014
MVFVVDRHHRPLQPCTPARARKLLASGRAVVHRHTPFVIRLKDREVVDSEVDGVELGIDPGSKFTGIAVFRADNVGDNTVRTGLFAVEVRHRGGQIRDKLTVRAAFRRVRRSRNLRYRAPRFNNRRRWAPVTGLHVERVAFDTQLLQNPNIAGVEYQHGTLHGYEVREYLLAKWARKCAYCGVKGVPLNMLVAAATGRGCYARTRCNRYGFPRLRLPRSRSVYGFQTGDLVHAVVRAGKNKGRHVGRVAVRTTGKFNIRTSHALVQGIHHRHVRLLQRADGWAYTREEERRFPPALSCRVSTPQRR